MCFYFIIFIHSHHRRYRTDSEPPKGNPKYTDIIYRLSFSDSEYVEYKETFQPEVARQDLHNAVLGLMDRNKSDLVYPISVFINEDKNVTGSTSIALNLCNIWNTQTKSKV